MHSSITSLFIISTVITTSLASNAAQKLSLQRLIPTGYDCARSAGDNGRYVQIRQANPAQKTIQCAGNGANVCSWYTDSTCNNLAYLSNPPLSATGSTNCNNLPPYQNLCLGPTCGPDSSASWCQSGTNFIYNGTVDTRPAFCSSGVCPPEPPAPPAPAGLSGGAIAGIVIGSLAAVALIGGLLWYFLRKKPSSTSYPVEDAKQIVYNTTPATPVQPVSQPVQPIPLQPSTTIPQTLVPSPTPSIPAPVSPYSTTSAVDPRGLSHISTSTDDLPVSGQVAPVAQQGYLYKIQAPHKNTDGGEIVVNSGDSVIVTLPDASSQGKPGFAKVKNLYTCVEGYIPLETLDFRSGGLLPTNRELTPEQMATRWNGVSGVAVAAYTSADPEELQITKGDRLVIDTVEQSDGWARGKNLTSGREGFLPLSVVSR